MAVKIDNNKKKDTFDIPAAIFGSMGDFSASRRNAQSS